jgi:hypothetical protein
MYLGAFGFGVIGYTAGFRRWIYRVIVFGDRSERESGSVDVEEIPSSRQGKMGASQISEAATVPLGGETDNQRHRPVILHCSQGLCSTLA